jgi:predicted CoA-binding protein
LDNNKDTLVIGASEKPNRYANLAISLLRRHGYKVLALGLKKGKAEDVDIETDISAFKDEPIDTITLYINPRIQVSYYDTIIGLKPRRVIFNPGTENPEFEELLEKNGIGTEEACTLVLLNTRQY